MVKEGSIGYNLIVSDIRMPNLDGYELAQKVKSACNSDLSRRLIKRGVDRSFEQSVAILIGYD